ncbi:predicted protein [Naegleria gruberi]|uniref:Predicted protein n=1 Tax=Naegleria gruberi TaxID=5762 RepID=D2VPM8_NAEGR|nr:uncharacterized protein NAEGRDRAFT_70919 [Naegleria gruberi]EFC41235.1 predicted protein [Naegleria gruberi]|eukprot:XP_002673979.1 predicted protein [Naegleria gruberi strain NEG-M]
MDEKLPVPKELGKQNKRHHIIAVNGRDRSCGKFIKSGRILRNDKKSGGGKYNYGTIGDESKVYVNDQDGLLNKDLINHDAQILDQVNGTKTVSIVPPKEEENEDEDEWEGGEDDEYYDEEGGEDVDEWEDEEE